ncbi:hypothetical protein SCHAM137S_04621 [Streptomyces chartreusis]
MAVFAVAVVVVTGICQSRRQVGSWDALFSSDFGRLLTAKAGWPSQEGPERTLPADATLRSALRRSVGIEEAVAVVVLALVPELRIALTLPSEKIGPLDVTMKNVGGYWASDDFQLSVPGKWRMSVTVRTNEIDQATRTTTLDIG